MSMDMHWEKSPRVGGHVDSLQVGSLKAPMFDVIWAGGRDPWALYGYLPGYSGRRSTWRFETTEQAQAAAERIVRRFFALATTQAPPTSAEIPQVTFSGRAVEQEKESTDE